MLKDKEPPINTDSNNNNHTSNNIHNNFIKELNTKLVINNFENFNLESLIQIEESLSSIHQNLNYPKSINFELYINYIKNFKYQKLFDSIPKVFEKIISKQDISIIILPYVNLQLISVFLLFVLLCPKAKSKTQNQKINFNHLKSLIVLVLQNFYFVIQIFLIKVQREKLVNVWTHQLQNIVFRKTNQRMPKNALLIPNLIKKNNKQIFEQLKIIITTNKTLVTEVCPKIKLVYISYNSQKTKFFLEIIERFLLSEKFHISIKADRSCPDLSQSISEIKEINTDRCPNNIDESDILLSVRYPFLPPVQNEPNIDNEISLNATTIATENSNNYRLTLVLDLDETLISFKMDDNNDKGLLRMRPGLIEFLEKLKQKNMELVIFTAATQDYADPIIDAIEAEDTYFFRRLYRQHSVIINNEFVKDLSKLGRDLDKVIIVDNNEKNFFLQQKNGILIKAFYGKDENDNVLENLYEIILKILDKKTDVRVALEELKEEIYKKITINE